MLRILKYLFILFSIVLTSCATHALYVPTLVNTPNFDSTNKYQINIVEEKVKFIKKIKKEKI